MKGFMLFLNVCFITSIIDAGVSEDTIVETSEGPKSISILKVGDKVVCLDKNLAQNVKPIATVEEVEVDSVIEVTTEDDIVMRMSPEQRVFIPYKWVQVDQLCLGDHLLRRDNTLIRIKAICHKKEPAKLRFITVEEHQNFFASKNGVLVHNGIFGANVGCFLGKFVVYFVGHGAIHLAALATGPAYYVTLTALEGTFALPIEAMSKVGAIAGGIAGGTLTGPV